VDCEENAGGIPPALILQLLSDGATEFLLEEIAFVPAWTLWRVGDALPDQKIELRKTHVRRPSKASRTTK